jgi:hypothetical protein
MASAAAAGASQRQSHSQTQPALACGDSSRAVADSSARASVASSSRQRAHWEKCRSQRAASAASSDRS